MPDRNRRHIQLRLCDLTFRLILSNSSNVSPRPDYPRRDAGVPPAWIPALVDRAGGGSGGADAAGALSSFQIQGSALPRRHRAAAREGAGRPGPPPPPPTQHPPHPPPPPATPNP